MRIVLTVGMLVVLGLSGCIGDEGLDTDNSEAEPDPQAQYKAKDPRDAMPEERRFEPTLKLETADGKVEYQSGDTVEFLFDITDREDYPFPSTFIDWAIFYEREPNPVAEGDADDLAGNWSRQFYGHAYHLVGFRADDGQGLKDFRVHIIQTGEPKGDYPDAARLMEFKNMTLRYYGEWVPPVDDGTVDDVVEEEVPTGVVYEPTTISENILLYPSCGLSCTGGGTFFGHSLAAKACEGLHVQRQGWGCGFVEIPQGATGQIATISTNGLDVTAEFLDECAPHAHRVGARVSPYIDVPEATVQAEIPAGARCLMVWTEGADQGAGDQGRTRVFVEVPEFAQPVSGEVEFEVEPKLVHVDAGANCIGGDLVGEVLVEAHAETGYDYMQSPACRGLHAGPHMMAPTDGAWIPVDERFAGAAVSMYLTSGVSSGDVSGLADEVGDDVIYVADTDCYFLDHMLNIIGNANNGGGPCAGFVPEGTHWLFVHSYWTETYSMTTTFVLDDAVAATALDKVGDTLMADYMDEGGYWRNIHTNICYSYAPGVFVTSTGNGVPGIYYQAHGGWFAAETNGIPGLQVDSGYFTDAAHPAGGDNWGRFSAPGCVFGDEWFV